MIEPRWLTIYFYLLIPIGGMHVLPAAFLLVRGGRRDVYVVAVTDVPMLAVVRGNEDFRVPALLGILAQALVGSYAGLVVPFLAARFTIKKK